MPRPPLEWEMIGITVGTTLVFWNDDDVTCIVVSIDPPRVYYEGEVMSLTEATRRVSGQPQPQGAAYWTVGGELLRDRRLRFEEYHVRSFNQASDRD